MRRLKVAESVISIVANVTVIGALVVALLSYFAQIEQTRRTASFDVISRLNSGEMLVVQRSLGRAVAQLQLKDLAGQVLPRDMMATLIAQLEETSADPLGFRQDVVTLVNYFDDAQICVETRTCDAEVMRGSLAETARRYACLLTPYVLDIRQEQLLDGLGDGLGRMVDYETSC